MRHHAGGLLYVTFWCLVARLVFHRAHRERIIVVVFAVTCLIEVLQLWQPDFLVPVRRNLIGGQLIGEDFDWWDFPHYVLGALLGGVGINALTRESEGVDEVS